MVVLIISFYINKVSFYLNSHHNFSNMLNKFVICNFGLNNFYEIFNPAIDCCEPCFNYSPYLSLSPDIMGSHAIKF